MKNRLILLGIDGATFDFLDYWMERGKLPTFKKLIEGGARAELQSTTPPISPVAWASFVTGANPGKHGVFGFLENEEIYQTDIVTSKSIDGDFFWKILDKNINVGSVGIPLTYPPRKLNGFLLSGFLSQGKNISYPPSLLAEVERGIGEEYKVDVNLNFKKDTETFLKEVNKLLENRIKAFFYLFENKNWDLLMNIFMSTDRASHFFWKERKHPRNVLLKVFERIDSFLAELFRKIDDKINLIIVSDHGFGELKKMVSLNTFFWEKGYIDFKGFKARVKAKFFKRGLNPKNIGKIAEKSKISKFLDSLNYREKFRRADSILSFSDIDWNETLVVSKGKGNVYINQKLLREKDINPEKFKEKLKEELYQLKDGETDMKIVDKIWEREELYQGNHLGEAPDLYVQTKDFYSIYPLFSASEKIITEHVTKGKTGRHKPEGIFIAKGPEFKSGIKLDSVNITDIAPTVLYLFKEDIPDYMDGNVLEEIFE